MAEELTCCTALSANSANSTDKPFKACFRVPHVLLFRAAQEGSGVVSEPKALGEERRGSESVATKQLGWCDDLPIPAVTGSSPSQNSLAGSGEIESPKNQVAVSLYLLPKKGQVNSTAQ